MLKLGNQNIAALRLGGTEIKKAYLGGAVVFDVSEPPVPTYTISASIDPAGSGTVSGAGTYQAGETVTITAVPEEGYQFTGWQENGVVVSEDAAYTFTVAGDRVLAAVFEAVATSRLPEGYIEVEYIYALSYLSTLDLGISLSTRTVELIIQPLNIPSTASYTYYCLFQASLYVSTTKNYITASLLFRQSSVASAYNNTSTAAPTKWMYSSKAVSPISAVEGSKYIITYKPDGVISTTKTITLTVNDNAITGSGTATFIAFPGANIILGTGRYSSSWPTIRYYSVKILSSAGEYVGDFVPCISPDGVVGMYNLVTNKFRGPVSTTYPWVAGPAV